MNQGGRQPPLKWINCLFLEMLVVTLKTYSLVQWELTGDERHRFENWFQWQRNSSQGSGRRGIDSRRRIRSRWEGRLIMRSLSGVVIGGGWEADGPPWPCCTFFSGCSDDNWTSASMRSCASDSGCSLTSDESGCKDLSVNYVLLVE